MELQRQITPNSCMSACLAMLLGEDVQSVTDLYHPLIWEHGLWMSEVLLRAGIDFEKLDLEDNTIYFGNVYLACVPSLNTQGCFHQIVIDAREEDNVLILDPSPEDKLQYTMENLSSWILDFRVTPKDGQ